MGRGGVFRVCARFWLCACVWVSRRGGCQVDERCRPSHSPTHTTPSHNTHPHTTHLCEDLVKVLDALLVLDLGDDLDVAVVWWRRRVFVCVTKVGAVRVVLVGVGLRCGWGASLSASGAPKLKHAPPRTHAENGSRRQANAWASLSCTSRFWRVCAQQRQALRTLIKGNARACPHQARSATRGAAIHKNPPNACGPQRARDTARTL